MGGNGKMIFLESAYGINLVPGVAF